MSATLSAEGLQSVLLPANVAYILAEAAWWPCILAGVPLGTSGDGDGEWGSADDTAMETIRARQTELAEMMGKAEAAARANAGNCRPEAFVFALAAVMEAGPVMPAVGFSRVSQAQALRLFASGELVTASSMLALVGVDDRFSLLIQDLTDSDSAPRCGGMPVVYVEGMEGEFFNPGAVLGFMEAWLGDASGDGDD